MKEAEHTCTVQYSIVPVVLIQVYYSAGTFLMLYKNIVWYVKITSNIKISL